MKQKAYIGKNNQIFDNAHEAIYSYSGPNGITESEFIAAKEKVFGKKTRK